LVASWQKVIIVGSSDYGTGWSVLPRPIKLTAILSLLDTVDAVQAVAQPAPIPPALPVAPVARSKPIEFLSPALNAAEPVKLASVSLNEAPSFVQNSSNAEQMVSATSVPHQAVRTTLGRVLIVDDSDIALKYMQNRLRHFGYESELVHSGEEALAMVATHNYHFVFLDVMMAGLDGYQTCKAIKNNKARRGPAPVVVMLTSRGGTIDKIRGSMAGCDAYLTKPLNDKRLGSVLAKFDESTVRERWEAVNPRQPLVDTFSPRNRQLQQH
jgi:CheY-like chemotaxis protein